MSSSPSARGTHKSLAWGTAERGRSVLAPGTELLGALSGSGWRDGSYLVRRCDGRTLQVSRLLYVVITGLADHRDKTQLAELVRRELGRTITAAQIDYLIANKLQPLGIVADDRDGGGGEPRPGREHADRRTPGGDARTGRGRRESAPLLAFTVRRAVLPQRLVRVCARSLRPLFLPPLVIAAVAGWLAADAWLLSGTGLAAMTASVVRQPSWLLLVLGITAMSGAIHELGHATASTYGGAEPGVIGVGVYLIWPAFYNDLNDSYRLNRAGRLRADLGGLYFNILVVQLLAGAYALSGFQPLVVAIVVQHLLMAQQLLPFVRLDGYYLVSDLAGVPDLFGRIRPILLSLVPGRAAAPSVRRLQPRARAIVTAWVLCTVPALVGAVVLMAMRLPQFASIAADTARGQARALSGAVAAGNGEVALLSSLQLALLALPAIGLGAPLLRLGANGPRSRSPAPFTAASPARPGSPPAQIDRRQACAQEVARAELERILVQNAGYERLPDLLATLA